MTYTREVIAALILRARLQGLAFLTGAAGSFAAVFVSVAVGLWLVALGALLAGFVLAGFAVVLFGDAKSWETL